MRFRLSVISALLLVVAGCSHPDTVATVKSPNGRVQATLTETSQGATTSFEYVVSLKAVSPEGESVRVASLYGAVRNEQAYGLNLSWLNDQTLELQYLTAKAAKLEQPTTVIGGRLIAIRLKAGVLDKSAPPGGMEHNRTHGLNSN